MEDTTQDSKEKVIVEGKAKITFANPNEVFYNPVQVFNRDLSVACIQVYTEELFPLTVKFKKKNKSKENAEQKDLSGDQVSVTDEPSTGII